MFQLTKHVRSGLFSVVLLIFTAGFAFGSTGSTSVGGGTLSWTYTTQTGNCYTGMVVQYTQTNFSAFAYVDSHGTHFSLNGGGVYFQSPGGSSCPPQGYQPTAGTMMTFSGSGGSYSIMFFGNGGGGSSATIA